MDLRNLSAVGAGGALGAAARYGVSQALDVAGDGFPWATFWTNVTGSLALGMVLVLLAGRLRRCVATGFLGAYTTYSTFAVETVVLAKDGRAAVALAYVAASLAGGLVAAWAGVVVARGTR